MKRTKPTKRTSAAAREGNRSRSQTREIRYIPEKCRVCGCTQTNACNPPCSWAEPALCSTCARTARAIRDWMGEAVKPSRTALWREAERLERALYGGAR